MKSEVSRHMKCEIGKFQGYQSLLQENDVCIEL